MQPTIRRTALAGLAVATLTLVGACGSGSSDNQATDTSTTGGDTSTSAVSALEPGAAVNAVDAKSLVASAAANLTSMKVSADMALGSAGTMHMEGVEQAKPSLLAQMSMTVAGQQMQVRMIGTDMYVEMPAAAGLPGGKKWMSMNFQEIGSLSGMDMSGMTSALQDPAAAIDQYGKYITGGTYVGPSTVDGVSAKQYDFTVDLKAGMAQMFPSGVPTAAAGQLPDSVKESIWIDEDNHPVQMKMGMGQLGDTTMHFSDFGTKVDVTAPPKNEVADMKQLMGQLGAS
jgi:hypothetical protein